MAPDTISDWINNLSGQATILDPMCGSGVVLRQAVLAGHKPIGIDVDPLAVLMSRVWTRNVERKEVLLAMEKTISYAKGARLNDFSLEWIDECHETSDFIDFWFARKQKNQLRKLSFALHVYDGTIPQKILNVLWLALSKTIITKHVGASLAWDVSHSRPHVVKLENDYDVFSGFEAGTNRILNVLDKEKLNDWARIRQGDGRSLHAIKASSVDAIFTSPPYLNAIDYMRGHRLSLVWMGYSIPYLRSVRSSSIGAERALKKAAGGDIQNRVFETEPNLSKLDGRFQNIVKRYIQDAHRLILSAKKVLKRHGQLGLVVGDSTIRGTFIRNSSVFRVVAMAEGFQLQECRQRKLETSRRYLPVKSENNSLEKRMRCESLQLFSLQG